jgi:hypothetical protein
MPHFSCLRVNRRMWIYDIHTGKPTGREVQAMHRLQILTDRYIAEGLTPADARTRAREELRANPRRDCRGVRWQSSLQTVPSATQHAGSTYTANPPR